MGINPPILSLLLLASEPEDENSAKQVIAISGLAWAITMCVSVDALMAHAPFDEWDCLVIDLACPGAGAMTAALAQSPGMKPMVLLADPALVILRAVLGPHTAHWLPKTQAGWSLLPQMAEIAAAQARMTALTQLDAVMDTVYDGVVTLDLRGRILAVNRAFEALSGYEADTCIATPLDEMFSDQDALGFRALLRDVALKIDAPPVIHEMMLIRKDGSLLPAHLSLVGLLGPRGLYITCTIRDLSESKALAQRASYQASFDALTDLPNRLLFGDHVTDALARASAHGRPVGVVCIDLDGFTKVNDTLGSQVGDRVLCQTAQRLTEAVPGGTPARFSSDEFAVLLTGARDLIQLDQMVEAIHATLAKPYWVGGKELAVPADLGVSVYPRDGRESGALVSQAETALHEVKRQPGVRVGYFDAALSAAAAERLILEQALKDAIVSGQFELYFQPQIDLTTKALTGAEALIRWHHPQLGMISPDTFIPVAEETGLIVPLGEWVIKSACAQIKVWRDAGLPWLRMGVNISGRQFREPSLAAQVTGALAAVGVDPQQLDLELTESMLMADGEGTLLVLRHLADLGLTLSVDDFGTGYSSLAYLKRFPVHTVKIDRAFIHDISEDEEDRVIVQAIISLAHSLSLKTIAEGVETEGQAALLTGMGCDEVQGYLYSKPVPSAAFIAFVRAWVAGPTTVEV